VIVDSVTLFLSAGCGGKGATSFIRKRKRLVGDGGEGGRGGDIFLEANRNLYDLSKFKYKRKFKAPDGERGKARRKKGKDASSLVIPVPCGTLVKDLEERIIADLKKDKERVCVVRGGEGGRGNFRREEAERGKEGERKEIILDYRILSDIAIVGFANTGKTSLFNYLTGKNFKVADYPFATTSCMWAPFRKNYREFIVLDTPPLKEKGENNFLKHLFRVKLIIIVVDNYPEIEEEVNSVKKLINDFDSSYLNKNFFYLCNKIDKIDKSFKRERRFFYLSTKTGEGVEALEDRILKVLG